MRVVGIDPGTRVCGWGVVEVTGNRLVHLDHGVVRLAGALPERLAVLFDDLTAVLAEHRPTVMAVEGVFTHKNARSALVLGHARGVALLTAARAGLEVHEYAPTVVKKSVVGSGRAEKQQIQRMIAALLHIPVPAVADAADALGVAVCHVHHQGGAGAASAVVRHRPTGTGR
jgi:crossover junction endodeoxyribonuclease RuvC